MHHYICFSDGVEKTGNNTILIGRDTPSLEYVRPLKCPLTTRPQKHLRTCSLIQI